MRPDAEVILSVLRGDVEQYCELVDRYRRTVCALAASVLGDRHLAEDAAQEAFVTAFQHLNELKNLAAFPSWLAQITRRQAVRLKSRQLPTAPLDESNGPAASPDNGHIDQKVLALLDDVMRLPEHERLTVTLHHLDGHSVQTVSRMTGRPVGTVTKQLSRAYERLRLWTKEASE